MIPDSEELVIEQDKKKSAKNLLIMFAVLCILWAILFVTCYVRSHTQFVFSASCDGTQNEDNEVDVTLDVSKSWKDIALHYDNPYGAQYDYMLINNGDYDFKDYSVELHMSEDMLLDSGWNGDYEIDGSTITFVGLAPVDLIPAHEARPFGAVMYSAAEPQLESFVVRGYWDISVRKSGAYWILIELTTIFLAYVLFTVVNAQRQKHYNEMIQKDERIIEQTMKTLTGFIDAKDVYTRDHSVRVAEYSREIAKRFGVENEKLRFLYYIALMHDCGKISIPDEILKKEGALTKEEFNVIKSHPSKGHELLKRFTEIEGIGDGAHYHHERYDGYGYPSGLEGEEIPLCARIICVADSYDAMSSDRCYRRALTKEIILDELNNNSGKQFDPQFVPIMIEMIEDGFVDRIREKYPR